MLIKPALHTYANVQLNRHRKRNKTKYKRYVGASEIGLCERRVWYAKQHALGVIDPKHAEFDNWGASRRGATFERHFWLPAMKARFGDNLLYARRQLTMTFGNLRATPDGLLVNQPRNLLQPFGIEDIGRSREIVVECKTVDPRIPLHTAKPEHEFQAQVQLGMFHHDSERAHRPDYALISYVNASFYDDCIEFVVKYDLGVFAQAQKRAAKILQATDAAQLKPEGWMGGGRECQWCPFKSPCDAIRLPHVEMDSKPAAINPQIISEFVRLGTAKCELDTRISDLEAEQREIQETIKSRLRDLSLREIDTNVIKITWSPVKGRPSWNMPRLREAAAALGLDIQQFETVGEPSDRLVITLRKRSAVAP